VKPTQRVTTLKTAPHGRTNGSTTTRGALAVKAKPQAQEDSWEEF
jgi:hypothetical protein